ncbi:hypothetical protein JL720_2800 [Aureococcus anophagefferens]|nr:hypothetical protein JL720_2800 [Aureococcus anophagefferens]
MKDYANATKRCYPQWGKRFGLVTKPRVGRFGSYTCDEAKLCLTTEDFGFKLGEDAAKAPTPPLIRLRYGEVHNEPESIAMFTGLSEVHLSHKEDIKEVHYMLQALGYVCYNTPDTEEERFWGEGIDIHPVKVYRGDGGVVDNKTQGPTYYSWPGSASRAKKLEQDQADLNEAARGAQGALQGAGDHALVPRLAQRRSTMRGGKMINTPGTLPGETPLQTIEGQIDDDKE